MDKAINRIAGKRGTLPNGIHVLVPIKTEVLDKIRIKQKQLERCQNFLQKTKNERIKKLNTPRVQKSTISKLTAKCEKYRQDIERIIGIIEDLRENAKKVSNINNWLLYSYDYLKSVAEKCIQHFKENFLPRMDYNTLQKRFQYPQKVVSSVFFFHKKLNKSKAKSEIRKSIELEHHLNVEKLARIIECPSSDIRKLIEKLQSEKKIEGQFMNEHKFNFTTDNNKVIEVLHKEIEFL